MNVIFHRVRDIWELNISRVQTGKTHFWISIVISSLGLGALHDVMNRFPLLRHLFTLVMPASFSEDTKKHETYTVDLVSKYSIPTSPIETFFSYSQANQPHN